MDEGTLPDINWGRMARLLMQHVNQRGSSTGPTKRKKREKSTPYNFTRKLNPQIFNARNQACPATRLHPPQATENTQRHPFYPPGPCRHHHPYQLGPDQYPYQLGLNPHHPQAILSQVQELRMQLLRQLVHYQKQLLALQVPEIPVQYCHGHYPKKSPIKRKFEPVKMNPYEITNNFNKNINELPKTKKKKKSKRVPKQCTNKISKSLSHEPDYKCEPNILKDRASVKHCIRVNNPSTQNIVKRKNLKHNSDSDASRVIALDKLRNVPYKTNVNQRKNASYTINPNEITKKDGNSNVLGSGSTTGCVHDNKSTNKQNYFNRKKHRLV